MSDIPSGALDSTESRAVSLLSRIILPRPGEPLDVRKLYIEESETNARRAHAPTRTTLEIGAESEVSFATYFNAFPASYWRRWSILESVVLRVELTGSARIDVYRSKATGARITVGGTEASSVGDTPAVTEFEVELAPFEDGGWIWFDITTDTKVTVHSAGWYAPQQAPGRADVAIGIPTFNRPADCVSALSALTSDPLVDNVISAVIVSDQGTRQAKDHPGFEAAAAALGDRLSVRYQPNLGGSGGYSRVMYEALKNTECEQILFMDDDIRVEPDSILRALAFNRFAKVPTLVGGQMLNLQEPSHLHVMGEMVDSENFMWTGAINTEYDHNFAKYPLNAEEHERSRLLHRRIDVDYNGWWMCMIPRQVAQELGQPLPLFIKWDDAEYGLRAGEHGYPTVTLPGAAIWHMAWSDKDDAIDWQAYFHLRNRLVAALLHSTFPRGGRVMRELFNNQLAHLVAMQYSTAELRLQAMEDVLRGPQALHEMLATRLPEINATRKEFSDAQLVADVDTLPPPRIEKPIKKDLTQVPSRRSQIISAGLAPLRQLKAPRALSRTNPEVVIPAIDAKWYRLAGFDSAIVSMNDGTSAALYRRDPELYRSLLKRTLELHARFAQQWPELARQYRDALGEITSPEAWEKTFAPWTGGSEGSAE